MKDKFKIIFQICFIAGVFLVFAAGLLRMIFAPREINVYENRKANKLPEFSVSSFLDTEYQDGVENAVSDQIHLSEFSKKHYNKLKSRITIDSLKSIYQNNPDRYYTYDKLGVFGGDYLMYWPTELNDKNKSSLSDKASSINDTVAAYPDIEFYLYYIEKDTDINFELKQKIGLYDYLKSNIAPADNLTLGCFEIDSFKDFAEQFFKTDHHWNKDGSYNAYTELVQMLGCGTPAKKGEVFTVNAELSGSKTSSVGANDIWTEEFSAYRYDFVPMKIILNGYDAADYGSQNIADSAASYGSYYGGDDGEIIFDTGFTEKDNILIVGESYDNAVLKLLAAHFNRTYSVDLRNYEHYMGKAFDFDSYITEKEIDKVLFIGNVDYFLMSEFSVR